MEEVNSSAKLLQENVLMFEGGKCLEGNIKIKLKKNVYCPSEGNIV